MSGWKDRVPGGLGETTVVYAGPAELRLELPARTPEQAEEKARELVERATRKIDRAVAAVATLRGPYPASLDAQAAWLRGAAERLRAEVEGSGDAFHRLAEVSWLAADADATANGVLAAATGIGRGGGVPGSGRHGRVL